MKKLFTLISVCLAIFVNAQTTSACACCSEPHKQFDFWLGHWDVYDTTGKKVGENLIESMESGCGLRENWRSNQQTGTSTNYFDPADNTWNQLWIDNAGTILSLKGAYNNNKMELKSAMMQGKKVAFYYNVITWEKNKDGTVTQIWDVRENTGKLVSRAFKGIYKLKVKDAKAKMPNDKQTH
jgi:hypothetical protein